LDGVPGATPDKAQRTRAQRLATAANQFREGLPALDDGLGDRVMHAIHGRAPLPRRSAWRWLVELHPVRVRPVWVPALAAAAVVLWLGGRSWAPSRDVQGPRPEVVAARDTVFVRFELVAPGARLVAVAGSFNGWRPEELAMSRGPGGVWAVTALLPLGRYQYQFVVDGERWIPDPGAQAQADDGFGGINSVVVVGAKGVVRL
jgi:hypothetical protein